MKPYTPLAAATALAAILALSMTAAQAGSTPSATTDPGFNPQPGQINPGQAPNPGSATAELPQDKQPSQDQARAALMIPDPVGVSSLGEAPSQPSANSTTTTGAASSPPATQAAAPAASTAPQGPIGATLQTVPAKFSERNDLLDHLPVMAWPLLLNEQQRQQIYQAVMADKTQPATGADTLKPAVFVSYAQKRDMHPLPQTLSGIDGLQGLQYIKAKDKVLLVRAPNGIVVDQIMM